VIKKTRLAVVLECNENSSSPLVSSKWQGKLADEAIAIARRYGIPVKKDPNLVNKIPSGTQEISESLSLEVAQYFVK
jgi:type III secretion system FlhB-like substrate exporter